MKASGSETAAVLREAASFLRDLQHTRSGRLPWEPPLADWLEVTALSAQRLFDSVQSPSAGVDQPPGIKHGEPDQAEAYVAAAFYNPLRVARGLLGAVDPHETVTTKEGLL